MGKTYLALHSWMMTLPTSPEVWVGSTFTRKLERAAKFPDYPNGKLPTNYLYW